MKKAFDKRILYKYDMEQTVSDTLGRIEFWMDESKRYYDQNDIEYSGLCFDKAYTLAESLLSMYISDSTFLVSCERDYLENILGKEL